jgi:hypothetical protein
LKGKANMRKVSPILTIFLLLFLTPVLAQDQTDSRLWGIWKQVSANGHSTIGDGFDILQMFTPTGAWGVQYIEGISYGDYTATDGVIYLNGTSEYAERVDWSDAIRYEYTGRHLRLYDFAGDGMVEEYERITRFTALGFIHCPASVKSTMFVGAYGHVAYTDGSSSRVRSDPGLSSEVLELLDEGAGFLVVGEPACADGYTWWPINSNPYNPGSGRDNSTRSGWIAEGADGVAFIEPIGWVDRSLLRQNVSGDVDELMQEAAEQLGATYYAPGEYPLIESLARAIASGSLAEEFPKTYDIVNAGALFVLTGDLQIPNKPEELANPVELICFNALLSDFEITPEIDDGSGVTIVCLLWDTAKVTGKSGIVIGGLYFMVQNLLNPKWIIDRVTDPINEWAGSFPMTRFICAIKPEFCPF